MADMTIDWLCEFFSKRGKDLGPAKADMDIFEAGLVDSFGIVELVTAIETAFNIELRQGDLADPRFRTIRGIAEIIQENILAKSRHG